MSEEVDLPAPVAGSEAAAEPPGAAPAPASAEKEEEEERRHEEEKERGDGGSNDEDESESVPFDNVDVRPPAANGDEDAALPPSDAKANAAAGADAGGGGEAQEDAADSAPTVVTEDEHDAGAEEEEGRPEEVPVPEAGAAAAAHEGVGAAQAEGSAPDPAEEREAGEEPGAAEAEEEEAAAASAPEPAREDFETFAAEQAAAAAAGGDPDEGEFEAFAAAVAVADDDEDEDEDDEDGGDDGAGAAAEPAPVEPPLPTGAPSDSPQQAAGPGSPKAPPPSASALASSNRTPKGKGGGGGGDGGGGGAAAAEAAPLPAPTPLSNSSRTASHSKLRSYEARRRSAYASKLASSSLYWRSFRDLMSGSVEETERAESILRCSAVAAAEFGLAMRAAHDGTVDGNGRAVTDPKKRKKMIEGRERRRAERGGGGGAGERGGGDHAASAVDRDGRDPPSSSVFRTAKAALYTSGDRPAADRRKGGVGGGVGSGSADRGGILGTLIESNGIMADRFDENAKFVREEILPEIESVREGLNLEVAVMERLGDAIMEELQAAEREVEESWKRYYAAAVKSLGGATIPSHRRGATSAESGRALSEEHFVESCADVWVEEMKYRMSVAFLSACWEKSSAELSKLFGSMKGTECNRRFRLRELLIIFLNKQERLWLSLPPILTPVIKDLTDKPMDRNSIESEVQASIRLRAQSLQREESTRKKELRKKGIKEEIGPGLKGVETAEGDFELSSPLVSDLLVKANVIEKRSSGMMSSWKTTLAVVTADSFLHLFELPTSVRVHSGSAPEVAFHALVPPVEVPTDESAKSVKAGKMMKEWYDMLTPAESLALPNCTVSFKEEKNSVTFEITERILNTGASSVMLGKTTTRKLYVRTLSKEETKEWIAAVKARK